MKNTGILTIIITIFLFVGCASQPKQAALDKEPPAESVAVEVSPSTEEVVVKSEKATIYFDRTTKKWSLEKKDRKQPRYVGEIADGIPSGKGALYLPNGFYEGEFKNGKFNGKGKRLYFEKGKLVGEFKDNKAHGQGIYTYLDGAKYVGEYKLGKKHGQPLLGLMGVNMWAIGNLEREKVMELELILMEGNMKVNGKMACSMDRELTFSKMVEDMRVSGKMIKIGMQKCTIKKVM